ncbi:hypothetical protein [Polynucleobacter sp.]|uniref:hypothetical protein n=1 Tax=Polynucleobacter sp. TaxID=2029855 RepID=UPI003F6A532E
MILALLNQAVANNWIVTSANAYTKLESSNNAVNLSCSVNGGALAGDWLSAENINHFASASACSFNLPATNTITVNPILNGITIYVRADCYDAGGGSLGYVGFAYILYSTGTQKLGVYLIRYDAGYASSEQSSALSVPSFNGSDVFTLSVDPATRQWNVSKGGNTADGDAVLGLMPLNTSYVKYSTLFNVGGSVQGFAEISIISIVQ